MERQVSYPKSKLKIALLEKVHSAAAETFREAGYSVTLIPSALQGAELNEMLSQMHVVGVRSRTQLRAENLQHAKRLLCIGCFSVGTDQVELPAAMKLGVPVFNAPHSSTRSVAELTIGMIVALARRVGDKNTAMHQGRWEKSVSGATEVRNKTLGIIGYGHIGQQVGILGELFGLNIVFYDVVKKLPFGRARSLGSLNAVLEASDFVSLHIPSSPDNTNLMNAAAFACMRQGACLINHSRGSVVDLEALRDSLMQGHLGGAALDVFPEEPAANEAPFESTLLDAPNVILTPHIGGSTEEAQLNIGREVATSLIRFIESGSTEGAVNFPPVFLPAFRNSHRILNIHHNVPGVIRDITKVVSDLGANIDAQYLSTHGDVGYLIMDINRELSEEVKQQIASMPSNIRTRVLF